jgi:hypothetical protein
MDPRGIAETVGATLVGSALAAVGLWLFAGEVNWLLVVGIGAVLALASAASYRDSMEYADLVDDSGDGPAGERDVAVGREVGREGAAGRDIGRRDAVDRGGERRTPDREPPTSDEAARPPDSDR